MNGEYEQQWVEHHIREGLYKRGMKQVGTKKKLNSCQGTEITNYKSPEKNTLRIMVQNFREEITGEYVIKEMDKKKKICRDTKIFTRGSYYK